MSSFVIREATDADRRWAAGVMSSSEPWLTLRRSFEACLIACSSSVDVLYVAECERQPCGLALVRERGLAGAPYLVSIAVAETYRGQGIGEQLLRFVEDLFRGRFRHLFLCVSSFNSRARVFYERHGYRAVGALPDFIVDGHAETLMMKRL